MARPQSDLEAGREQIIDAVENLVRQRGAIDISMTELAADVAMSPSNLYRFFENKEALLEAVAERWFAAKIRIMEEVVASDLPIRDKTFAFFARRFEVMVGQYQEEPDLFKSYLEIGQIHFEVVRGYVDLGDHYLAVIVAEAMEAGYFSGLSIDETVSLINQMVQPYCNPEAIVYIGSNKLKTQKLNRIIDAIFIGLGKSYSAEDSPTPHIKVVS